MSAISIPNNNFEAGTAAVAEEINDNFDAIVAWSSTAVKSNEPNGFTIVPTLPATPGTNAYSVTHKTYVDDGFEANTGFKMISGSGTPVLTNDNVWKQVCVVSSGTAIPANATNQTLYLTAFCDAELNGGNGPTTFSLRVSFSVDGGTTYGATQQVSGFGTGVTAGAEYTGMALTGFHSFTYTVTPPATPQIMTAKLEIVQRASLSTVWTVSSARCRLAISREVPFA